jgi:integrase
MAKIMGLTKILKKKIKARPADPVRNKEDVKRVAEYIRNNYENGEMLRLMFLSGCNTGLRAGDIRQIKIKHLLGTEFEIMEQKTKKHRLIYVNDVLREQTEIYYNEGHSSFVSNGGVKIAVTTFVMQSKEDYAFCGSHGGVIGVKYMHYVIRDACKQCGLKGNYGSHTMRKTFAFHCYKLVMDLERVKTLLNHSNAKLTQKYICDRRSSKRAKRMRREGEETGLTIQESYSVNLS